MPADGSKVFMYGNKLLKLKLDRHQLQETVGGTLLISLSHMYTIHGYYITFDLLSLYTCN